MSWNLRKTELALDDLTSIWEYIAADNREAADKLVLDILQLFDKTAEHPHLGRSAEEIAPDIRMLTRGRYLLIYRVIADEKAIELVRVVHGARDLPALFDS